MFTGIITDIGTIEAVDATGDTRLTVASVLADDALDIGASIACAGVCLTVVERGAGRFAVSASAETRAKTTLGGWRPGTRINLERALKMGDEMGGHIVFGHVDAVARIVAVEDDGQSRRFVFEAPEHLAHLFAAKGSVALDGVSLTVNEVDGTRFGVNVIPYTLTATTFGRAAAGDEVNLEADMLARYVARILGRG
jgi:riboflavin synthase